jgi:hypothetical protein
MPELSPQALRDFTNSSIGDGDIGGKSHGNCLGIPRWDAMAGIEDV